MAEPLPFPTGPACKNRGKLFREHSEPEPDNLDRALALLETAALLIIAEMELRERERP